MAQALHRFDMRLRLGSARETAATQRQAVADAEARKHIPTSPTVKTAAETQAQEAAMAKAKAVAEEAAKPHKYHIRPLSESKAIESGANFISETFLFLVAGGLIVFESWRSRRKEATRREGVEGRLAELEQSETAARGALAALEKELLQLKVKHGEVPKSTQRILPREVWVTEKEIQAPEPEKGWFSRITSYLPFGQNTGKAAEGVQATADSKTSAQQPTGQPSTPTSSGQTSRPRSS